MRVLMVIYEGSGDEEQAVAARNWLPLLEALVNQNVVTKVVLLGRPAFAEEEIRGAGHDVESLGASSLSASIARIPRLHRIMRSFRPDIVHSHEVIPAILGGVAGRLARLCPLVFHRQHAVGSRKLQAASRAASALNHVIFAVSEPVRQYAIRSDKKDGTRVFITYNGSEGTRQISRTEIGHIRSQRGISEDAFVVAMVARLRAKKNHVGMLEAADRVAREMTRPIHLVIVGSGPEKEVIEEASRKRAVHVHLVGHQNDPAPWFGIAHISALPSFHDPCPFAAIESLSAGVPVLGADVDGIPEIVGSDGGVLVDPYDVGDIARGLRTMLGSADSGELRLAARRRFEQNFTPDHAVRRWVGSYEAAREICSG